jgi:uncharacterized protein YqfB (UPF0267 family)
MTAINFTMFTDKVANGTKTQTIRATTRARAGEVLQLYVGQRTKDCRKVRDVVCKSVAEVMLMERLAQVKGDAARTGIYLEEFAHADGFDSYADMWAFFSRRANDAGEFHGKLIKW